MDICQRHRMWCLIFKEDEMMYVEDTEQCCGNCIYNNYDRQEGQWCCICADSEAYGLLTAYGDSCEEWEER